MESCFKNNNQKACYFLNDVDLDTGVCTPQTTRLLRIPLSSVWMHRASRRSRIKAHQGRSGTASFVPPTFPRDHLRGQHLLAWGTGSNILIPDCWSLYQLETLVSFLKPNGLKTKKKLSP